MLVRSHNGRLVDSVELFGRFFDARWKELSPELVYAVAAQEGCDAGALTGYIELHIHGWVADALEDYEKQRVRLRPNSDAGVKRLFERMQGRVGLMYIGTRPR